MKHTFRVFALSLEAAAKLFARAAAYCNIISGRVAYRTDGSLGVALRMAYRQEGLYFVEIVGDVDALSKILPEVDFSGDRLFHQWDPSLRKMINAIYSNYGGVR